MGRLGTHKDVEKAARAARKQGWDVSVTGNNHICFTPPTGSKLFGSMTGCEPGRKKFLKQLQKAGLVL